jgi:hypothetical protein
VETLDRLACRTAAALGFALAFALIVVPSFTLAADAGKGRSLSGEWGILIVQPASGCEWNGVVRLVQRGEQLSGRGSAAGPSGSPRCPRLEGEVNGTVQGGLVRFGFGTGPLGRAEFEGRTSAGAGEMAGTWATRSASGDWAAAR